MTDTRVTDLLERLALTAPEPAADLAEAVLRSAECNRRPPAGRRLMPALVAAATVVAVLLAVGVVAIAGRSKQATAPAVPASPPAAQAALTAGKQFAQLFFSPDYRSIDDYNRQVADASTGAFRDDFVSKQGELAQLVTKAQSVAHGDIVAAAPREVTATTAKVLVAADQSVQNTLTHGKPQVLRMRASVSLRLVHGRWLADGFEPVVGGGGPGCADRFADGESNDLLGQSCTDVARLFSFDYRSADWDVAAQRTVVADQTLVDSMWSSEAKALARREHLSISASAYDAAIEQQTPSTATVLVFVNQDVKNDALSTPRIDRNRLQLTMTKVDGRWLISGLRAL